MTDAYLADAICPKCGQYSEDCERLCICGVHTAPKAEISGYLEDTCLCCGESL